MGVDTFWKRVPVELIDGRDSGELSALVPYWFDTEYEIQQRNGILVGAEDTAALIDALLWLGAADGPGAAAAETFAEGPPDWDDDHMVGTLSPAVVRELAQFLSGAPLEQWVEQHHAALAAEAESLGYRRPFDEGWAEQVLHDAQQVAVIFHAAAANNEAMIVKVSA